MKKMTTILTAAALTCCLSVTALAASPATINTVPGSQDIDVNAVYQDEVQCPTVYNVDISWGAMEFTYTVSGSMDWDTNTKTYTPNTTGNWTGSGNAITVTNSSNTAVNATFSFAASADYNTVSGTFDPASIDLASADKENVTDAELSATTTLTLDGALASSVTESTKIGTVTVSLTEGGANP